MKFLRNYKNDHAILSPSQWRWLNYETEEDFLNLIARSKATEIGTLLHTVAADRIEYGMKLKKGDRDSVILELLKNGIPRAIIDYIDFDLIFENLYTYVNDCIGFRMYPEVELRYSDICKGTADAISYREKDSFLRIHDLKTGTTPAHMEQLLVYSALFFLQNRYLKLSESKIELRIYQNNEVLVHNPGVDEILPIMDKIENSSKFIGEVLQ